MSDRNNADPGLFTILNQVVDGLATRLQIASIELSVAKNNAAKTAIYAVLAALFGLLGKARNLAANMPYAFEESRQILAADVAAFRASCNKKAGVAAQQPVDPTEGENNNAGK